MKNLFFIITFFFLLGPTSVYSSYKMGTGKPVKATEEQKKVEKQQKQQTAKISYKKPGLRSYDEGPLLAHLSEQFNIDIQHLQYLRDLNHGYEDLIPALVVAKDSQAEVGKVLKSVMEGKSWKDICAEFSVDEKLVSDEAGEILSPLRKTLPKDIMLERAQNKS